MEINYKLFILKHVIFTIHSLFNIIFIGYGELEDDADAFIAWLHDASEDVLKSKKFKELLKVILALGNYLNGGQRGGAYGFKLNSILKVTF